MKQSFYYKIQQVFFAILVLMLIWIESSAQFSLPGGGVTGQNSPGAITINNLIYIGYRAHTLNTAVGNGALLSNSSGYGNTAFGNLALSSNTTTHNNVGIGNQALQFALGGANTCIGFGSGAGGSSGSGSHTGINNTAVGSSTIYKLTSGNANSAFGVGALFNNATSDSNTAVGTNALVLLTGGRSNTAVGNNALYTISSGISNVGVGSRALFNLNNSDNNVGLGNGALSAMTSGNNNVGLGANTVLSNGSNQLSIQNVIYGINMTSGSGNVGIGVVPSATLARLEVGGTLKINTVNTAPTTGSYLFVDGNNIVSKAALIGTNQCSTIGNMPIVTNTGGTGNMGCSQVFDNGITTAIGVASAATYTWTSGGAGGQYGSGGTNYPPTLPTTNYRLYVSGWTGATGYIALSDQRLKNNIKVIESPLDKISKISGYTYNWKSDEKTTDRNLDSSRQSGFMAQEVVKVLPEAVVKSSDGLFGINYNGILPLLTEGIKAQQKEIKSQSLEIEDLKNKIEILSNKLNQLAGEGTIVINDQFQVIPNPVTNISSVTYDLKNTLTNPAFVVYNLQGMMLKKYAISANNKTGSLQIKKSDFGKGMFILSLISNNEEVQSKRFLITD